MDPGKSDESLDVFIERLAGEVVARHMAAPAIVLLESSKPLTFVGSQTLVFFDPIISMVGLFKDRDRYREILEDRARVEQLITAIERLEEDKIQKKKVNKDAQRGY